MRDFLIGSAVVLVVVAVAATALTLSRRDAGAEEEEAAAKLPGKLVMISFTEEGSEPCERMKPVIDQLAKDFKWDADFVRVDVRRTPDVADRYGVSKLPTFVFVKSHQEIHRRSGTTTYEALAELVETYD